MGNWRFYRILTLVVLTTVLAEADAWEPVVYTYHKHPLVDQATAKQHCQERGGQLAMPKTMAHARLMLANAGHAFGKFWIGAEYDLPFERIVWADGDVVWKASGWEDLAFSNWEYGQPNSYPSNVQDCVQINSFTGRWNDVPCSEKRSYVCQKEPQKLYTYHTGRSLVDQRTAKQHCQWGGGRLAMPKTNTQAETLLTNAGETFGKFWIGAEYDPPYERIVWADGDVLWKANGSEDLWFSNWWPGQPNSHPSHSYESTQNCVQIDPRTSLWNDVPCSEKRSYVCQKGASRHIFHN